MDYSTWRVVTMLSIRVLVACYEILRRTVRSRCLGITSKTKVTLAAQLKEQEEMYLNVNVSRMQPRGPLNRTWDHPDL